MIAATLSLIGVFVSVYLAMWKLGWMGIMACGTGSCQSVQLSPYAYLFGIPVAFLGVFGYLATLVLSLASLQPKFQTDRRVTLGLILVSGIGVAFTAYLSYLEAFVINAWCRWCLFSAAIIVGVFVSSLFGLRRQPNELSVGSPA